MFLGFANFYCRFIQGFSWIAASLILILKTSRSTEYSTGTGEGVVGVGGDSRAGRGGSEIDGDKIDGVEVEVDEVGKKARKTSNSKNSSKSQKTVGLDFLTLGAKLTFTKLKQAFLKAPILHHLIRNVISGLRRMYQAILLVES